MINKAMTSNGCELQLNFCSKVLHYKSTPSIAKKYAEYVIVLSVIPL